MAELFLIILNMSFTGAFVITAICLARLPLKKAPKAISYCLWSVAGFRLISPLSFESIFSLMPIKPQPIPMDITMQPIPRIDSGIPFMNNAVSGILPAATPHYSANPLQMWAAIGACVWFIGVIVMLIYSIVSIILLKRGLRGAAHLRENIYESAGLKTPFVIGLYRLKIYIPAGLSDGELNYILLHEQTHIKRRDHIVKLFAYLVLCLHWFNPFVWAAFLLMGADMEMSCDERVIKELGGDIKNDYTMSLVRIAAGRRILNGSPLAFGEGGMKERVKRVLNFKKPSRVIIVAAVVLAAVLGTGFAMNRVTETPLEYKNTPKQEVHTTPDYLFSNFSGKQMGLDDVRELAAKGSNLLFEDLRQYKGMNVSSDSNRYILVFGIEGGYRLIVHSNPTGKPDSVNLECIWESGGSGIDIRYNDVEEFIKTNPSQPAIIGEDAANIARAYSGKDVTLIDADWWEYAEEFPHHSKDPAKQALSESLNTIGQPVELFIDIDGAYIAVGRRDGAVYTYDNGVWFALTPPDDSLEPQDMRTQSPMAANVSMLIYSPASGGLSYTLENHSENEYTFGEDYSLYIRRGNHWESIAPVIENWGFNSIGYILSPRAKSSRTAINWLWLFGELPAGDYKIQKVILLVREPGDYDDFVVEKEFSIY